MTSRSTIALSAVILAGLWLLVSQIGVGGEIIALALVGGPAVGGQIGWMTRASVRWWVSPMLAAAGIAFLVVAFSQYNDDGPSGALFVPLLYLGLLTIPAAAVTAGISVGSHLRRDRDAGVDS